MANSTDELQIVRAVGQRKRLFESTEVIGSATGQIAQIDEADQDPVTDDYKDLDDSIAKLQIVRASGEHRRVTDSPEAARLASEWIAHIDEAD